MPCILLTIQVRHVYIHTVCKYKCVVIGVSPIYTVCEYVITHYYLAESYVQAGLSMTK